MQQEATVAQKTTDGFIWKLISILFHPLFIPVYVIYILAFIHPTLFAGFGEVERWRTVLISAINLVFFPLLTVFLLKSLGFISSFYLRSQRDRIIPYIAFGIFSFWAYTVFKNQNHYPDEWSTFILGVFLASSAALIANIYTKVSMHAIGVGGWIMFMIILSFTNTMIIPWLPALVVLISGLVCTARLQLKEHSPFEIYLGLAIGIVVQMVAWWYAMM